MPSGPGIPTLDQLRIFLTIVDVGSFAGAARKLGRATSVISYSIANLEAQLGVSLFDRESTRKPQLTEAGRMVLAEARTVSNGVDGLRVPTRLVGEYWPFVRPYISLLKSNIWQSRLRRRICMV